MSADVREEAVRRYLQHVHDPFSIIDDREVQALEAELGEAVDVVERLALRQQLQQARTVDAARCQRMVVAGEMMFNKPNRPSGAAPTTKTQLTPDMSSRYPEAPGC